MFTYRPHEYGPKHVLTNQFYSEVCSVCFKAKMAGYVCVACKVATHMECMPGSVRLWGLHACKNCMASD